VFFLKALDRKLLAYLPNDHFANFYGHLVYFLVIWYKFSILVLYFVPRKIWHWSEHVLAMATKLGKNGTNLRAWSLIFNEKNNWSL
jgi:hypothetical protein